MAEAIDLTVEYGDVREEEQLDWPKLIAHLREQKLPGADAPLEIKQFRGGSSNLTYLLRFGDQEWVVRRPPFGPLPVGGHDMAREFRVLSRVWQAFKPAPRAMLFSDDISIIGAPFFVMERRDGIVFKNRQPVPAELGDDPATFKAISEGFIDTLADLHAVDYEKIGLGGLGKPDGIRQAPDNRMDAAMGKGQDRRGSADGPPRRVVPRAHAAPSRRRPSCTTIFTSTTSCSIVKIPGRSTACLTGRCRRSAIR